MARRDEPGRRREPDPDPAEDERTRPSASEARRGPHARRPAFNPGLLASPFYGAATRYGGAGGLAAQHNERRHPTPTPTPSPTHSIATVNVKPSNSTSALSRTAKRICDLLAFYSSPISDAKRAPARLVAAANASTSSARRPPSLQPLRSPSMAALVTLKRNNRKVDSARAAIAASLSSSSPLPAPAPGDGAHSNKMRARLTGRNRDRDALSQYDMPTPVRLPEATLELGEAGLPDFAKPPRPNPTTSVRSKLKRGRSPDPDGATEVEPSPEADRVPAKKFHFSDPLDGTDPNVNPFGSEAKAPASRRPDVPPDDPKEDREEPAPVRKRPPHMWNGTGSADGKSRKIEKLGAGTDGSNGFDPPTKTPAPPKTNPALPSLDSFIKKQQSQWECDGCLTRNDSDKEKCVCCETPKPGGTTKPASTEIKTSAPTQSPKTDGKPAFSGFASFMQKQKAQWECACCLTRNDTNRVKCVCCEATNPNAEADTSTFNFGSNQTSTFKFGIDKADQPVALPSDKPSEDNKLKNKDSSISSSEFTFGIPPSSTKLSNAAAEVTKTSEFKFGIPNGSALTTINKDKTEAPPVNAMFKFKETIAPVSSGFTFGFNNQKDKESSTVKPSSDISKTSDFTSPQQKVESTDISKKEINSSIEESKSSKPEDGEIKSPIVPATSSIMPLNDKDAKPLFTFGAPSTVPTFGSPPTSDTPAFGGAAPKFNFGSPVTTSIVPTGETTPFKSSIFTFGNKTNSPTNATPDIVKPVTSPIPKPQFSLPVSNNQTLFSVTTSTTIPTQPKITNVSSLADSTKLVSSPFTSPTPLGDKPKELSTNAPVFNFGGSSVSSPPNAVPNIFKPITTSATPVFSFGASTTKSEQPNVPIFGSLPANSSGSLFGNPVSNENKTASTDFKPPSTSASTFAPIAGSIFGSSAANSAPQSTSTNLFGNTQTPDSKSTNIFALNQGNAPQSSVFNQSLTTPTFNFGSSSNTATPSQTTSFFNAQPANKLPTAPESTVNAFMNKTQSAPANIFNSTATPSLSSGGIFGSHPAVPTPVFGASIPFGDASQAPSAQNAPFKFGETNSIQSPMTGFGQVPAAGSSAPVFAFGSSSAAVPVNSQFNFSMGAPSSAFPTTPGTNPNMPQRRFKKAVRRNVQR